MAVLLLLLWNKLFCSTTYVMSTTKILWLCTKKNSLHLPVKQKNLKLGPSHPNQNMLMYVHKFRIISDGSEIS